MDQIAFEFQDRQQNMLENQGMLAGLERIMGLLFSGLPLSGEVNLKQFVNSNLFGEKNEAANSSIGTISPEMSSGDLKDMVSLNMQLKNKYILGILFAIALLIVMLRVTKHSDSMKTKLPKLMSIFWFYCFISLYLDLNILSLETKPYSKILFLGITAIDQSTIYISEILHLLLFIVTLFYFFSLILRFNELFGNEEVEQIVEQLSQANRPNNPQVQNQLNGQQQEIGGIVSQSLMVVDPLSIRSSLQFYHFVVLYVILFMTFTKIVMLSAGLLFVRVTNFPINTLDNLEIFPHSPRLLSLFTVSFFAFSSYIGRTSIDKSQYFFQKVVPFLIALLHSCILILKRRYIFTIDDILCLIIFVSSISIYLTYESPSAAQNNRFPWPFLHSEIAKKKLNEEQMKQLLKVGAGAEFTSEFETNIKLSQEEIQRRQILIEQTIKKRQQEHEEYMRQKEFIRRKKMANFDDSNINHFEEYDDEYSDSDMVDNDFIEDYDAQSEETKKNYMKDKASQKSTMKLQEILLHQLSQLNDETRKILTLGGGIDLTNEQELLARIQYLASIKNQPHLLMSETNPFTIQLQQLKQQQELKHQQQQQQQQQQQFAHQQQQQPTQATQGGQGQQQSTVKQTAHKAPTKAPSGRPNQRKRR